MSLTHLEKSSDKNWFDTTSKISHFLINELAILRDINNHFQQMLPSLFKAYELALEHKLINDEIPIKLLRHYQEDENSNFEMQIHTILQTIKEIHRLSHLITKQKLSKEPVNASHCIEKVLKNFSNEHQWIKLSEKDDFNISFSTFFIESALNCLLHFAISHFKTSTSHQLVDIRLKKGQEISNISVIINSPIIQTTSCRYLLENYLIITAQETLPGIPFCQLALTYVDSCIAYEIKEAQSLELIISIANQNLNFFSNIS